MKPRSTALSQQNSSIGQYFNSTFSSAFTIAHRQHLPDARLTAAQRRRLGHMLRCLDGREEYASHFEVATALFGRRLVSAADWHDSAFRYQTLRSVRDGLKMVERGYRQLLRARRRLS
ncbi:DUF2285 domain-containing protein [Mesorhizobium sp. CA16]|uniref:DUF2285 domain-containing protein n=2 Tax=unclassified Mesorhizobium TaxID=325217 RepID=UPI001CCE84BE|nr:DUF2285 domain-containing protein [Mesorhizobium sp. CA16]MBZ9916070.1 DUF2285 domain-containing protein [Mesorhizobium sp. CA16]